MCPKPPFPIDKLNKIANAKKQLSTKMLETELES